MAELRFQEFLARNEENLKDYKAPPTISQILQKRSEGKGGGICIISCSDARVDPARYFGVKLGEALVIQNAGGRAADAIRSLEVMGTIGPIDLIVIVHHTDCGGLFTSDAEVREKLSDRAPAHAHSIKDKWFGTFGYLGLEESIRHDVEELKSWPFLPSYTKVMGYSLDLDTGAVKQVV